MTALGHTATDAAVRSLVRVAVACRGRGDYAIAIGMLNAVLVVVRSRHVRALVLNEMGMACKYSGLLEDADAAYRAALRLRPPRRTKADLLHNLAGVAHARGDATTAARLASAGIRVRAAADPADPCAVRDAAALAAILLDLGDVDAAERMLGQALAGLAEPGGAPDLEVAVIVANLGTVLYRRGRFHSAIAAYRRALALKEAVLGPEHAELGFTRLNLGAALLRDGQPGAAAESFREAESLLAGRVDDDSPALRTCRRYLRELDTRTG